MKNAPQILVATENSLTLKDVSSTLDKVKSPCSFVSARLESVIDTLKSKRFELLILDCSDLDQSDVQRIVDQAILGFPQLTLLFLFPEQEQSYRDIALDREGSFYLDCPLKINEAGFIITRALDKINYQEAKSGTSQPVDTKNVSGFIGSSLSMRSLFDLIDRVAEDEDSTVLIRGESGTGKELVARAIHRNSIRAKNKFVPVNCAAIPDELLESELFGHIKGSFTGAIQSKQGRIQYADGGTLFLDEIGDMKPSLQAKLLRVLQEKEFEPVGSLKPVPVNTRILAATHCNLEALVGEGKFREDLYYRLSVIPVQVPPLRDHNEDIPELISSFVDRYTLKRGRDPITFSSQAMAILKEAEWRGNVRELENLVQHMSILYSGKTIYPEHLPQKYLAAIDLSKLPTTAYDSRVSQPSMIDTATERAELLAPLAPTLPRFDFDNGPVNFNELVNSFEKELILEAMKRSSGNKKEAARLLNLKRTTLLEKIKKKESTGLWEA